MQLQLLHFLGCLPLPLLDSIAFSIALTGLSAPLPPRQATPCCVACRGNDAGVDISKIADRW
jgi:hypothetical protein